MAPFRKKKKTAETTETPEILKPSTDSKNVKKRKKFRGKKKPKGEIVQIANVAPKLKDLSKEDVSSNWKNLVKTVNISEADKPASGKPYKPRYKPKPKVEEGAEIWFDDVDDVLLEGRVQLRGETGETSNPEKYLVKENSFSGLTKIVGMDCEMVGIGKDGEDSILARVSIVNHFGNLVYDTYVAATERVTDFRTHVSGIRPQDIKNAPDFKSVQTKVSEILKDRVLVGHAIHHDLKVLYLDHPRKLIRDTSKYKPFRARFNGKTPALKRLSEMFIGVKVQTGEHSSIQDAQAAVRLYTMVRTEWESAIREKHKGSFHGKKKPKNELNNKPSILSSIQKDLSSSGTRKYVDSDSD